MSEKIFRDAQCGFQLLRVFGGHYWVGEQTLNLPPDKQAMLRMPPEHLQVNKKDPEGRYWICVTIEGVSLVSVDRTSQFQRKFLYSEDSLERLLRWGAKQNLLQLIVQAVGTRNRGRMPLTICINCPAAIDVAYHIVQEYNHTFSEKNLDFFHV